MYGMYSHILIINLYVLQHRLTAAIMLRRLFIQMGESLLKCSHDVLESCKADLLTALQQETSEFVRKELCDDVAKLARICAGEILHIWWRKSFAISCFLNSYLLLRTVSFIFIH